MDYDDFFEIYPHFHVSVSDVERKMGLFDDRELGVAFVKACIRGDVRPTFAENAPEYLERYEANIAEWKEEHEAQLEAGDGPDVVWY